MENGREGITEEGTAGGTAYLPLAEWMAEFCILFPFLLSGFGLRNTVQSVVAGVVLWCIVVGVMQAWGKPGHAFLRNMETHGGRKTALSVCLVSLWYFLAHTAVFTRLWASLFQTYLTPAVPAAVLCVLPLAVGLALCGRGPGFRERVSRYAGVVLLILFAVLTFLMGSGLQAGAYRGGLAGGTAWNPVEGAAWTLTERAAGMAGDTGQALTESVDGMTGDAGQALTERAAGMAEDAGQTLTESATGNPAGGLWL